MYLCSSIYEWTVNCVWNWWLLVIKKQLKSLKSSTSIERWNNNKVNNNVKKILLMIMQINPIWSSQVLHAKKLTLEGNISPVCYISWIWSILTELATNLTNLRWPFQIPELNYCTLTQNRWRSSNTLCIRCTPSIRISCQECINYFLSRLTSTTWMQPFVLCSRWSTSSPVVRSYTWNPLYLPKQCDQELATQEQSEEVYWQ